MSLKGERKKTCFQLKMPTVGRSLLWSLGIWLAQPDPLLAKEGGNLGAPFHASDSCVCAFRTTEKGKDGRQLAKAPMSGKPTSFQGGGRRPLCLCVLHLVLCSALHGRGIQTNEGVGGGGSELEHPDGGWLAGPESRPR